eukprot:3136536-Amphidinium_carterae.1
MSTLLPGATLCVRVFLWTILSWHFVRRAAWPAWLMGSAKVLSAAPCVTYAAMWLKPSDPRDTREYDRVEDSRQGTRGGVSLARNALVTSLWPVLCWLNLNSLSR